MVSLSCVYWLGKKITNPTDLFISSPNAIDCGIFGNVLSQFSFPPTASPTTATLTKAPTYSSTTTPSATKPPNYFPTYLSTIFPSFTPSVLSTNLPTFIPTLAPTLSPTTAPTLEPTMFPSISPTITPLFEPTFKPTFSPTLSPTLSPTFKPTNEPTFRPTDSPTSSSSVVPSGSPSNIIVMNDPTAPPSSAQPSNNPTIAVVISYVGCYIDKLSPRAMPAGGKTYTAIQDCITYAQTNGFTYFGTQWYNGPAVGSFKCWFTSSLASATQYGSSNTLCVIASDKVTIMGGTGGNAVYMITAKTSPPVPQPVTIPVSRPTTIPFPQPTTVPISQPTIIPVRQPITITVSQPTVIPVRQPTVIPVRQPTVIPVRQPTPIPISQPTGIPISRPTITSVKSVSPSAASLRYIGCYLDKQTPRAMPIGGLTYSTLQDCMTYAKSNGFTYFGTQWYNGPGVGLFQCWFTSSLVSATQYGIGVGCVLSLDGVNLMGGGNLNALYSV